MPADAPEHCATRRRIYWTVGWLLLITVALMLDTRVAAFAQHVDDMVDGPLKRTVFARLAKLPGDFRFTLAIAAIAIWTHPWKWRAAGLVCLSALVGAFVYIVLKWTVGRRRPTLNIPFEFSPFIGGWRGLFVAEPNLSFPSGHATCAFATAAALAVLYPRARWVFYGVAAITAVERVAERAHYLSDVVAAAGIGILSVQLAIFLAGLFLPAADPADPCPVVIPPDLGQADPAPHE